VLLSPEVICVNLNELKVPFTDLSCIIEGKATAAAEAEAPLAAGYDLTNSN
jgi:hypothetical protein